MSNLQKNTQSIIAKSVYDGVINRTVPMYFFLGRTLPWEDEDNPPPSSGENELTTRKHIISLRRILPTETTFVIERQAWKPNEIYDMYDDSYNESYTSHKSNATSLIDAKIFVINSEYNIYKCIYNNHGGVSTEEPKGQSLDFQTYSDNYIWKYMMTLSHLGQRRFLSNQYMPIQNSIDETFFTSGIRPLIKSGGSGYVYDNTFIRITGDGEKIASFRPIIDNYSGEITNIIVDDPGLNYTNASIKIETPYDSKQKGSGAVIDTLIIGLGDSDLNVRQSEVELAAMNGEISCAYVTTHGKNYSNATVTITGDGEGAAGIAVINNTDGSIVRIDLTNRGKNYSNATVTITGDGEGADARIILSPYGGHGRNIQAESFASSLAFYSDTVTDTIQNIDINPDYRQSGIIVRPTVYSGDVNYLFNENNGSPCWVTTTDKSGYEIDLDTILYRVTDNEEFIVIAVDNTTEDSKIVLQGLNNKVINKGDEFINRNTDEYITITEVSLPQVDRYSGTMLYYDNKKTFRDKENQNIILKTYINF